MFQAHQHSGALCLPCSFPLLVASERAGSVSALVNCCHFRTLAQSCQVFWFFSFKTSQKSRLICEKPFKVLINTIEPNKHVGYIWPVVCDSRLKSFSPTTCNISMFLFFHRSAYGTTKVFFRTGNVFLFLFVSTAPSYNAWYIIISVAHWMNEWIN